jgi:hypothetical protein
MTHVQTIAADIRQALVDQPVIDTHEHTRRVVAGEVTGIGDLMGRGYVRACFRAATGAPNSLGKVLDREMPTTWKGCRHDRSNPHELVLPTKFLVWGLSCQALFSGAVFQLCTAASPMLGA